MAKLFLAAVLLVANTIAFCPSTTKRPTHTSLLFFSSRPANDFTSPDKFQSPPSLPDSLSIVSEDEGNETTAPFTVSSFASTQDEDRHTPFQIGVRATCLLATASYIINPEPLDDITSSLYSCIKDWEPASNPLFEAQVAVMGFFIPIVLFSCLHLFLGKQKTMQSRFDGKLPTRPFEWLELENLNLSFNPVASYLLSIWIYHQFVHPHAALPELAPTFGVFAIELIFGVWLYDCLFFPLHWLMHKSKFGRIRKCHGYHHRVTSHSLNALETVQHSYMDGFLQVAVNILVQQITPFGAFGHKHFLSRLAHNIVVTYLLTGKIISRIFAKFKFLCLH